MRVRSVPKLLALTVRAASVYFVWWSYGARNVDGVCIRGNAAQETNPNTPVAPVARGEQVVASTRGSLGDD